jgi:hypothetical protein
MLGFNAVLYRNTGTYGTPVWVALNNVVDLTLGDEMDEVDVSTRGSGGFSQYEPGMRNLDLTFQMLNRAADADVAAIRTAYNNKAAIDMQVLDNLIANDGVGIRASWKVFQFPSGQELRGAQTFDVVMKPCYATNNPALIDP